MMRTNRTRFFDISIMDDGGDFHNEEIFYDSIQCEGTGQVVSFKESIAEDEDKLPTFIQEIADMVGIEIYFREVTEEIEVRQEDKYSNTHNEKTKYMKLLEDEVKKIDYTPEQEEMFKSNAKAQGTSILLEKIYHKFF